MSTSQAGVLTRNMSTGGEKSNKSSSKQSPVLKTPTKGGEGEWTQIQIQLKEIKSDLNKTLKADDVKELIKNVVEEMLQKHQDKIEKKFNDKIEGLKQENRQLKDSIEKLEADKRAIKRELDESNEALNDLHNRFEENENMAKAAFAKANQNEQYSRKYNVKFHGLPETEGENPLEIVNNALAEVGVEIQGSDVVAIHRIPGKPDEHKPIIVKFLNIDSKIRVMRKRSEIKDLKKGWKVTDDVTKANVDLIIELTKDPRIKSAWFFNGSIYGQYGTKRVKFDIFDNIERKLKNK